jgi:hypothetical protein
MQRLRWFLICLGGAALYTVALLLLVMPHGAARAADSVLYVAADSGCGGKTPCYTTLQDAVNAATAGDEVRIAAGTYTGSGDAVVEIAKNLMLRGGYTTTFASRDPARYPTYVDGEHARRVIHVVDPETYPLTLNVTLEGLHVIRGRAVNPDPPYERGGGIYVERADQVTIRDCHITDNADSGALTHNANVLHVADNEVYSNTAYSFGGGLELYARQVTIENNEIYSNSVDAGGSGLFVSSQGVIRENHIHHNQGSSAVSLRNSDVTLINNFIVDNADGGVTVSGRTARLLHTTLARNGAQGVFVTNSGQFAGTAYLTNTILISHTVGVETVWVTVDNSAHLMATLWGNVTNTTGTGTIETERDFTGDAAFVDADAGDYHLTADSAARNRGIPTQVTIDFDGESRDPLPDLGADEKLVPGSIHNIHLPLILRIKP